MPTKPNATNNRPVTRTDNRRNGTTVLIEDNQDIKDAQGGRRFLEEHSLLCPPGEPTSPLALSTCLHQISLMSGISKPATNAIRSVAFLLEEMEEVTVNETIRDAFESQISEFTSDMKMLIEDAKEKIDNHIKNATASLATQTAAPAEQANPARRTYANTLINPLPNANPLLAAREGIKARQILLEGLKETPLSHLDNIQLKKALNKILEEIGIEEGRIRTTQNQRDGTTLIEMDSDVATSWIKTQANASKFCAKVGNKVSFRLRQYNIIAFNVPTNLVTDNHDHRIEISEANNFDDDTITALRWAKPIERRSPEQRTAHLIITLNNAEVANRAIAKGIYICNRNCRAERIKKEPPRCMKCQGWNHFAKDCPAEKDTCGNCAEEHRTRECQKPQAKKCASCKAPGHASWDRNCPEFIKRLSDFNKRNPENSLQFFPSTETWTWTPPMADTQQRDTNAADRNRQNTSRQPARSTSAPRRMDTYIPRPNSQTARPAPNTRRMDSYIPERDELLKGPYIDIRKTRWGDDDAPFSALDSSTIAVEKILLVEERNNRTNPPPQNKS